MALSSLFLALAVFLALSGCALGCPKKAAAKVTAVTVSPPKYEGCYEDKRNRRDLAELAGYNPNMSKSLCEKWCRQYGTPYFGMQEGMQCWCGTEFGKYGKAEEVLCAMRCVGERDDRCGGILHNSVYKIIN